MNLDLRHARAFVVLAEELHFGRAARRLFITQPALSRTIRQVEQTIGARLVDRTTRHVSLTPGGEALLDAARAAVEAFDNLVRRADSIGHQADRTLRVAHQIGAALSLVPDIVRRFTQDHPDIHVELREFDFGEPLAGIDTGVSDVAFVRLPLEHPDLCFEILEREPLFVGLPTGHRLADRAQVSIEEILDEPILAAPKTAGPWRDYWLAMDYRSGAAPTVVEEAANFDAELQAVAFGKAVTITSLAAKLYYARPGVVFVPIADAPPCDVALAWIGESPSSVISEFVASACAVRDARPPRPSHHS
jgi:DNA-binding transcriptional LysR family regulator